MTKMEKQDAIDFIFRELDDNRSLQAITESLSKQLGAPPDVVEKFVAKVAAKRPEPVVERGGIAASSTDMERVEIEPAADDSHDQIEETQPKPETRMAEDSQSAWLESLSSKPKVDQAELEVMITKELAKNTRQSDVVVSVCEFTGMNWDEAQRLVAKVALNKRQHLARRRNLIFVPMAVIAILAGLALIYASVSESYVIGSTMIEGAPLDPSSQDIQTIVWAIPIGVGLLLGGGIGLYKSLRAQLE
jgi:hypothetical protein